MWHVVAHTVNGRWLFRSWPEGLEVWERVWQAVPDAQAVCVMPDHVHVLAPSPDRRRLGAALSGLARWRNHQEGVSGRLVRPLPPAEAVPEGPKRRRSVRYVHLNPCRARLVADPLAWPLSTHRDAVGLTWERRGPARRRDTFHAYVSSDPAARVEGTSLPGGALRASPDEVMDAVAAVMRVPRERLGRVPLARRVAGIALIELSSMSRREAAGRLGVSARTLRRDPPAPRAAVEAVCTVAGDERFQGFDRHSLLTLGPWQSYARRRGLSRWGPWRGR